MSKDDDDGVDLLKTGLIVAGTIVVAGIAWSLFKTVLTVAVVGGIGYGVYRLVAKGGGGKKAPKKPKAKALPPGSPEDFEARMRELDALEKELDQEIEDL